MVREGIPRPPILVGEKIICLEYFDLGPFKNLQIILSISFLNSFLGSGSMVAIWVSLESRQVLVMFTLAVVVSFRVDQRPISVFLDFMAFSQLMSSLSSCPVK